MKFFSFYPNCVYHNKLENSERDGNTRPPDLPLEKPVCVSKQQLELGMEEEISITSDMQMTPPLWHKVKKN